MCLLRRWERPYPALLPPLNLSEKQQTTQLLLESGATIDELNAMRKHLSTGKGGQFAQIAYPATVVSLFCPMWLAIHWT